MSLPGTRRRRWFVGGVVAAVLLVSVVAGVVGGLWPLASSPRASSSNPPPQDTAQVSPVVQITSIVGEDASDLSAAPSSSTQSMGSSTNLTFSSSDTTSPSSSSSLLPAAINNLFSKQGAPAPAAAMGTTSTLLGLKTCFPKTGAELEQAVLGPECTVIFLTNGYAADYKIREVMNVTAHKVLVGNPIDIPKLNATNKIERLFNVMPGGRLDVRAVCLYKGAGRSLNGGRTKLTVGGAIKVYPGGSFRGTGVIFREARGTLQGFLNELRSSAVAKRTFGGMVFVAGGHFVCFGCHIIRFNPYGSPDGNQIQVGGNFLVLVGACSCIGCYNVGFNLFSAGINVGSGAAVLGGVLSLIGGGNSGATTAVGQFGAGQSNFVGGGVLVFVGFADVSILLAICRAGFGQQAVGGGVMMLIGHLEDRSWAVGSVTNAGQTYSVGGGILQMHGGEIMNFQVSLLQIVSGGSAFNGGGDLAYIGMVYGTFGTTFSQHGLGMRWCQNAGTLENILINGISTAVVRSQFILGSESYLGTGFFSSINQTRYSYQLINAAFGGHEYWVGPGAAAFIKTYSFSKRLINYRTNPYAWVVAGTYIGGSYKATNSTPAVTPNRGDNIFVNKTGVFYVTKDGLELLPAVKPPTKQAEKALRQNESTPHRDTPTEELPHLVNGPLGPGGSGGIGDEFMAASLPKSSPSPAPILAQDLRGNDGEKSGEEDEPLMNSILVVDSAIETTKARPPNMAVFRRLLGERQERRRSRRLGSSFSSSSPLSSSSSGLKPLLGMLASPEDVIEAFKGAYQERAEEGDKDAKEKEFWPEYIYAKRRNTKCFLCGLQPLPSSSHVNPDNDPIDTQWWLSDEAPSLRRWASAAITTVEAAAPAAALAAPAADNGVPSSSLSSGATTTASACSSSDVCTDSATPKDALMSAESAAPPEGLPSLPPGLKTMQVMEARGRRLWEERRLHTQQRQQRQQQASAQRREENEEDDDWLGGSSNPVKLPDANLFWKKLTVHCPGRLGDDGREEGPGKGCGLTDKGVKRALKRYIDSAVVVFGEDPTYKLSAAYGEVPAAVHEAVDEEFLASLLPRRLNEACPYAVTFKIFVLTRDDETHAALLGAFAELARNTAALTEVLATKDAPLCPASAKMEDEGVLYLPSIDTSDGIRFYQQWHVLGGRDEEEEAERRKLMWRVGGGEGELGEESGAEGKRELQWASVSLLSPVSVGPVSVVRGGETYSIVLQGFDPRLDEVVVEVVRGLASGGQVIASSSSRGSAPSSGSGGDDINGEVHWTMDWMTEVRGEEAGHASSLFFLYAHYKGLPGYFAFSTPFRMEI